jgi:hypothetical protein
MIFRPARYSSAVAGSSGCGFSVTGSPMGH